MKIIKEQIYKITFYQTQTLQLKIASISFLNSGRYFALMAKKSPEKAEKKESKRGAGNEF